MSTNSIWTHCPSCNEPTEHVGGLCLSCKAQAEAKTADCTGTLKIVGYPGPAPKAGQVIDRKELEHLQACKQVMLDMHEALGVKFGNNVYAAITALREAASNKWHGTTDTDEKRFRAFVDTLVSAQRARADKAEAEAKELRQFCEAICSAIGFDPCGPAHEMTTRNNALLMLQALRARVAELERLCNEGGNFGEREVARLRDILAIREARHQQALAQARTEQREACAREAEQCDMSEIRYSTLRDVAAFIAAAIRAGKEPS